MDEEDEYKQEDKEYLDLTQEERDNSFSEIDFQDPFSEIDLGLY